jgi:hypothetical protein
MKTTLIISLIFSSIFVVVLSWSSGLDYSSQYASMMPLGITGILGIATLSAWGGVLGAWLDNKEVNN